MFGSGAPMCRWWRRSCAPRELAVAGRVVVMGHQIGSEALTLGASEDGEAHDAALREASIRSAWSMATRRRFRSARAYWWFLAWRIATPLDANSPVRTAAS